MDKIKMRVVAALVAAVATASVAALAEGAPVPAPVPSRAPAPAVTLTPPPPPTFYTDPCTGAIGGARPTLVPYTGPAPLPAASLSAQQLAWQYAVPVITRAVIGNTNGAPWVAGQTATICGSALNKLVFFATTNQFATGQIRENVNCEFGLVVPWNNAICDPNLGGVTLETGYFFDVGAAPYLQGAHAHLRAISPIISSTGDRISFTVSVDYWQLNGCLPAHTEYDSTNKPYTVPYCWEEEWFLTPGNGSGIKQAWQPVFQVAGTADTWVKGPTVILWP